MAGGQRRQHFKLTAGQGRHRVFIDPANVEVGKHHLSLGHFRDRGDELFRRFALGNVTGAPVCHDLCRHRLAFRAGVDDNAGRVFMADKVIEDVLAATARQDPADHGDIGLGFLERGYEGGGVRRDQDDLEPSVFAQNLLEPSLNQRILVRDGDPDFIAGKSIRIVFHA